LRVVWIEIVGGRIKDFMFVVEEKIHETLPPKFFGLSSCIDDTRYGDGRFGG
jgi:hypothetical protein